MLESPGAWVITSAMCLVACSGAAGQSPARQPGLPREPGVVLTLYRGTTLVWDRRTQRVAAGHNQVIFSPVPRKVAARGTALVSLTSPDAVEVTRVEDQSSPDGEARLMWQVEARKAGQHVFEASYTTDEITWQARYVLILDVAGEYGWLSGSVEVENHTDVSFDSVRLRIANIAREGEDKGGREDEDKGGRVHDQDDRQSSEPSFEPSFEPRIATLATGGTLARKSTVMFPLFPMSTPSTPSTPSPPSGNSSAIVVPAVVSLLYDPVDPELPRQNRTPAMRRDFGVRDEELGDVGVQRAIELDLSSVGLEDLFQGTVSVFQMLSTGQLSSVGRGRVDKADDGKLLVPLGRARGVHIRRRQTDFFRDVNARRLVEEIRVDLVNLEPTSRQVVVKEHMYRGRNWTVAYHNEVGAPKKVGPQTVVFHVPLASRATATIVYRVVYTW